MHQMTQSVSLLVVAWRRASARLLDFSLGYALWVLPAGSIAYLVYTPVTDTSVNSYLAVLLAILLTGIPVAFLLESLWYRLFGPTPGKRLFALGVVDVKGKLLTPQDYNARLLRLYCAGLLFGVPLLSQLGKLIQAGCFLNRGTTTYDEGRYHVLIHTPSVPKIVAWACLFTFVPLSIQVLNIAAAMAGY